ncbi:MAG: PEP-CTERM sorting domain-containing protein [Vicinamibacterales bacterium]
MELLPKPNSPDIAEFKVYFQEPEASPRRYSNCLACKTSMSTRRLSMTHPEEVVSKCRPQPALIALVLLACLLVPLRTFATPITTLSATPSQTSLNVGDGFFVDIAISDAVDLFDYQFDIAFNPSVIAATGTIDDGGFLTSAGGTSLLGGPFLLSVDNVLGVMTVLDSLTGPAPPATGASGSGLLVRINFSAVAPGTSSIELISPIAEDSTGAAIQLALADSRVIVSGNDAVPVPEPSTLILLGAGIAGAVRRGKRIISH